MKSDRIERLKRRARAEGIDCILLVPGVNLYYLTGLQMSLSERITLVGIPVRGKPFAIAPYFEAPRVAKATGIRHISTYTDDQAPAAAARAVKLTRWAFGRKFGVEYRYMRLLEFDLIKKAGALAYDIGPIMARLRSVKDATELRLMARAATIVDKAVAAGIRAVKPGASERAVADIVLAMIRKQGATGELSVASGPNSAIPHAHTTDRIMRKGEAVWIDIVVQYENYVADITRTCFAGKPDREMLKVFATVYEAQKRARTLARPGMTGAEIDALCRDYITEAGYGKYFTHRTGHGIGLEVHEEPYIVKSNTTKLKPGMTFTIEPGIYLPGKGGVRIEDDILLTKNGARSLTESERNLVAGSEERASRKNAVDQEIR